MRGEGRGERSRRKGEEEEGKRRRERRGEETDERDKARGEWGRRQDFLQTQIILNCREKKKKRRN